MNLEWIDHIHWLFANHMIQDFKINYETGDVYIVPNKTIEHINIKINYETEGVKFENRIN